METTIEVGGPIPKAEEAIQVAVNEVGAMTTVEALKKFDADGEPLMIGGEEFGHYYLGLTFQFRNLCSCGKPLHL